MMLQATNLSIKNAETEVVKMLKLVRMEGAASNKYKNCSLGMKQRIGIARAFLHDSKMIFLDEPTSNIDSLNEGMILRSLEQEKKDKTIILVSHRKSTMGIADEVLAM